MKNKYFIILIFFGFVLYFSSCYNSKEDVTALPKVSFLGEVVPIMISGGCGCHNNVNSNTITNNAIPFTRLDSVRDPNTGVFLRIDRTILYDAIIARVDTLRQWVNGSIAHPGAGAVNLTSRERDIIKAWINQGPPYDGGDIACVIPSNIKYTADILPIYNTTCKSAGCHGGRGPALDYNKLVADKNILNTMMSSAGASGHPGGVIGLSSCITGKFKAWLAAGQPK